MTLLWNLWITFTPLIFAGLLMWIIMEDFRHRAVRWWLFPLAGIMAVQMNPESIQLSDIILNSVFVLIQLVVLTVYFSLKEKRFVNITQRYLGWGDILLWGVLCLLFSSLNFVLFFMISILFTGMFVGLWKIIKSEIGTIPLAGMQAIALLLIWTVMILSGKSNFRNDGWIEQWILA